MTEPLLKVKGLKKYFPIKAGVIGRRVGDVKAVDDVSFEIMEGETLGIVGESGCGKSTTGRSIMRLIEPTAGEVYFEGKNVSTMSKEELRKARRDIQMVFQDPYASLNPRHNIQKILEEPLKVHGIGNDKERKEKVAKLLEIVGLSSYHASRYPHQFSGGQRQRIGIARALMTNPKLIIADEPVSALDLSVQAQVLNFMKNIQQEYGLSYLFISHDLGVVKHMCDNIAIMYKGRFVEIGTRQDIYTNPQHIYTKRLLSAIPKIDVANREAHKEERRRVEQEYRENHKDYYDENGRVYNLHAISPTHQVALKNGGAE